MIDKPERIGPATAAPIADDTFDLFLMAVPAWSGHTPARVVIEFSPVEVFTYSAVEMDDAIRSSGFDQWGNRGPAGIGE